MSMQFLIRQSHVLLLAEVYPTPRSRNHRPVVSKWLFVLISGMRKIKWNFAGAKMVTAFVSHCALLIHYGNWIEFLLSPFPVDSSIVRFRVARKSGWIKIIAQFTKIDNPSLTFHTQSRWITALIEYTPITTWFTFWHWICRWPTTLTGFLIISIQPFRFQTKFDQGSRVFIMS